MDLLKPSNKYSETSGVFNGNFQTLLELNRQVGFFQVDGLPGPKIPRKWWPKWVEL